MPRQGGITSGKPIVTKELYSRAAPEVTISKTNSPRGIPYNEVAANNLASLVDVAVQQPKIDLTQIRSQQQQAAALLALANNTKAANSLVSNPNQLVQQVQAERTKQQYYVNEAAAAANAVANYSGAARITPASTKPSTIATSSLSRPDAPAVIISERDRQTQQAVMTNAQNVIDAIITQAIQHGSGHNSELVKAAMAQQAAVVAAAANRGRQPHEQPQGKPNIPADMIHNRELSITPANPMTSTAAEDFKKRQVMITTSTSLTPTSSAAPPTKVGADERQIIRVAQAMSPAKAPGSEAAIQIEKKDNALQSAMQSAAAAISAATGGPQGAPPVPASPNGDQQLLDYVKNKIVEEMTKHGEERSPLPSASPAPGQKRPSPNASPNVHNEKKAKVDEATESSVVAAQAPESPGSPGDMVIDETERSETTPKAASPATPSSVPTTAPSDANAPNASANQAGSTVANSSQYEPLSDDE